MDNNIEKVSQVDCCGCSVCKHICDKQAIFMKPDNHGFDHPIINAELCVNCGRCLKVCPQVDSELLKQKNQSVFGVINNDKIIKKQSTSGGLFSLLADYILKRNGAIYGAIYDNAHIHHIRAVDDYFAMRGSKYCQSSIDEVISLLVEDLKNGKIVLFTGTPCQCAGIKKLLEIKKIQTDELLLVDIVCHGVVSPLILKDYITYVEKVSGKKVIEHKFRDKFGGWSTYIETNIFEDGKEDHDSYESQLYKRIFLSHFGLRESCFNCKFTSQDRISDITMADFWGLKQSKPEFWNDDGVSFAIISTQKGNMVMEAVVSKAEFFKASIEDTNQPQLKAPASRPEGYDKFWDVYQHKGFKYISVKYFHGGKIRRFISKLIHLVH